MKTLELFWRRCAADRGARAFARSADAGVNRKDGLTIRGLSTAITDQDGEPITPKQIVEVL